MKSSEKSSTRVTYQSVGSSIKNLLAQIESDSRNSRSINIPGITLIIEPTTLEVDKSDYQENIGYKTIFSPNIIKGRKLLAYTASFNVPYPVDNFILITSDQIGYNFVNISLNLNDQKLMNELIKMLPVNSSYKLITSFNDIEDRNNYKERFIFFNDPSSYTIINLDKLSNIPNKDVTAVYIDGTKDLGFIHYYTKSSPTTFIEYSLNFSYFDSSLIAGAILSEPDLYYYNKQKAMRKYWMTSYIYVNRTEEFKEVYGSYPISSPEYYYCYNSYKNLDLRPILSTFNSIIISQKIKELKQINEESLLNSCPSIY